MTLSGMISHAELFLLASCGTLGRCSLAEPLGSVETQLKITAVRKQSTLINEILSLQNCRIRSLQNHIIHIIMSHISSAHIYKVQMTFPKYGFQ